MYYYGKQGLKAKLTCKGTWLVSGRVGISMTCKTIQNPVLLNTTFRWTMQLKKHSAYIDNYRYLALTNVTESIPPGPGYNYLYFKNFSWSFECCCPQTGI